MSNIAYQITNKTIIIVLNKKIFNIDRDNDKGQKIIELIKSGQLDLIEEVLAPVERVKKVLKGSDTTLEIDKDGNLYDSSGEKFPAFLGKKILALNDEGFPVEIFLNFWANLKQNPSKDSKEDLFSFLEHNHHPLTPDGCFLAYKKVTKVGDNLMDSNSRTIKNNPGDSPKMERSKVNPNRNETCSTGLHVASWEYAQNFSGDVLVCVKVNPMNVVTVPTDYSRQKMRTCEYTVEFIYEDKEPIKAAAVKTTVKEEKAPEFVPKEAKQTAWKGFPPKEKVVNLHQMSAKEIVIHILETYGETIADISNPSKMKDKKGIIRKAEKIIANNK